MRRALSLLFVLPVIACVEPDPLATDESELVGGVATSLRPEIGTFGGCTATLIGPRFVLTAAHCLSPDYTGTTVVPGQAFTFTDAGGVARSYPIDRIHSFANRHELLLGDDVLASDVALLRLASAVPASQATPAALSTQQPNAGQWATIFGFGCQDRTAGGGGFKQFVAFQWLSPESTALCPGDSGGPVVHGGPSERGAIFGVNSGYWFNDGTDIFGYAALYKPQIERLMRDWTDGREVGFDRPGMDFFNATTASAAACQQVCQRDGRCRAFTWVTATGACWLKDGVPDLVPGAGLVSGLPAVLEPGLNRSGLDYRNLTVTRAEECAATCARDTACKAWTFINGGSCWLKNGVPSATDRADCTSGVIDRSFERSYNRGGADIASLATSSARLCAAACARNEGCKAFTWTSLFGTNCWLKGGVPAAVKVTPAAVQSGVRRGVEPDSDRAGGDYRGFATVAHPYACQTACAADNACQAWTWIPAPPVGSPMCWLKSSVRTRTTAIGLVSGVKGLEFQP